jgi:hypothetical protein
MRQARKPFSPQPAPICLYFSHLSHQQKGSFHIVNTKPINYSTEIASIDNSYIPSYTLWQDIEAMHLYFYKLRMTRVEVCIFLRTPLTGSHVKDVFCSYFRRVTARGAHSDPRTAAIWAMLTRKC